MVPHSPTKALRGGIDVICTLDVGTDADVDHAVEIPQRILGTGNVFVVCPVWSVFCQVPRPKMETLVAEWKRYRPLGRWLPVSDPPRWLDATVDCSSGAAFAILSVVPLRLYFHSSSERAKPGR